MTALYEEACEALGELERRVRAAGLVGDPLVPIVERLWDVMRLYEDDHRRSTSLMEEMQGVGFDGEDER